MACPCITAETWVSVLEDDRIISKPADTLTENDTLLGARGNIAKLSGTTICGTMSERTVYYGINDRFPFFSPGQPLWTHGGWKAIDPDLAKKENSWLIVGRLSVGDHVHVLPTEVTCPENVKYEMVKITRFTSRIVPSGSPKVNLHCREGARSFHANGFLMANNYPEITSKRVADNINRLSLKEKSKILKNLHKARPIIKNTFGFDALPFIKAKLESDDPVFTAAIKGDNSLKTYPKAMVPENRYLNMNLIGFNLTDMNTKYGRKACKHDLPSVSLINGQVFVNQKPADYSHIWSNKVFWRRAIDCNKQEHGVMTLHTEGLSGQGAITLTSDETKHQTKFDPAKDELTLFAADQTMQYTCTADPPDPPFVGIVEIGFKTDSTGRHPVSRLLDPDTGDEITGSSVTLHHDEEGHLAGDIDYGSNAWLYGWKSGTVTWSWDYQTFDGEIYEYDSSTTGNLGAKHTLHGVHETSPSHKNLLITAASMPHPNYSQIGTFKRDTSVTEFLVRSQSLLGSIPQSVEELSSMPPPEDSELHQLSQDKILRWMKYHMDDGWISDILGEEKPQISDSDKETIDKADIKGFLVDMGKAYLVKGLQGVKSLEDKFDKTDADKALYYWAGDGTTSVGKNTNYNTLSNLSGRQAFGELIDSNFQRYLNGEGGSTAAQWGKDLYDYLTSDDMFPALCADVMLGSRKRLNSYCMMLYLLAPDKSYSTDLNKKVLFGNVMKYFNNMSTAQREDAKKFIHDSLKDLILAIVNDDSGLFPNMKEEITKAFQEAGMESSNIDAEMIEEYVESMQTVITNLIDTILSSEKMPITERMKNLSDKLNSWESSHPNLSKGLKMLGHVMSLAAIGYAFYNIIEGFLNWSKLPWQQKVQLITGFIQNVGEVGNIMLKMINVFRKPNTSIPEMQEVLKEFDDAVQSPETVDAMAEFAEEQSPELDASLSEIDEAGLGRIGQVASADASEVSRFEVLMNWTEKVCKALNAVALVAACIGMGFQIKNDFDTNQPPIVKACDILQEVGMVIQIGVELAGLFVESAALPVIGIVVAIVGVVLMIISMIFHTKPPKPETPAEKFIDDYGKPFLNDLDNPSQEWLDKYNENHPEDE